VRVFAFFVCVLASLRSKLASNGAYRQDRCSGSGAARLSHWTRIGGTSNPTHFVKATSRVCSCEQIVRGQEVAEVYLWAYDG
jgi:hypothetical protein